MTDHIPVPYGYFKSQESRLFQSEEWAITGPEHDHEEYWDLIADGIPDEATARFIVTACNCHDKLLEALKIARDTCAFLAECNADADPEDHERLAIVTEAIRKAEEQS